MTENILIDLLERYKNNDINQEDALRTLKDLPFERYKDAVIDHHRALRQGVPEVIYCEGKTSEQIFEISRRLLHKGNNNILLTRLDKASYDQLLELKVEIDYNPLGRTAILKPESTPMKYGKILIVSGGTSDIPVAEEASETLKALGCNCKKVYDVGVAGIHRLFAIKDELDSADIIIAIAGMEGALPSVVGGLVEVPVIAVPTSVGYGANLNGMTPLLAMLNSCASGIGVVNIDNGFGAAFLASSMIRRINKFMEKGEVL